MGGIERQRLSVGSLRVDGEVRMPQAQALGRALQSERQLEREFIGSLPHDELTRKSDFHSWSGKDLLAHITSWKQQAAMRLRGDPTAVPDATDEQVNAANAGFFEAHAGQPWEAVRDDAEATHVDLMHEIEVLSDATLDDPHFGGWTSGLPLWRTLASNTLGHSFAHLAEHAIQRRDAAQAVHLATQMVEVMNSMSSDPGYLGAVEYNGACLMARAGETTAALDHLAAGLRARPDLVEWSKKDPDLEALRSDVRLAAMYAQLEG